jgi:hypothetical protein
MLAHVAEQTADPAHANDSDGQDASNTAVEKYSDSLQNLQDLSNAAEFVDHEKDHHGATSTRVQQQVGPFEHHFYALHLTSTPQLSFYILSRHSIHKNRIQNTS